ncbi:hypothetical protein ASPWEDRAFT_50899 [Aspergillus wentii DTO 134E9]|uniref:Transcription factor domain-containing protein n=1 Tax=Aspergillus wentii DTO 134E9 TaxID=1073089 RepID=A0A1L9RSU7_ASPWE|nr:uncharacterized protein ASPWEDRAFT_50899 [Aspergillus wentii DTO 134E9]OJJ37887.1 hypothetical protein ASPWEDRAFT_50899 [Aspergillus wentii DTO 134E9]
MPGNNRAPDLPSQNILEMYVMRYTSAFQSLVCPVISKSLFMETLDLAYGPFHVFGYTSAKSCVYAFLSLVTLFGFDDDAYQAVDCGSYTSAAHRLVPDIIQEMTVDGLQSLIMLTSSTVICETFFFWLCYSFDKDICLRTGQPPSIEDSKCDLSLTTGYFRLQDINIQRDTMELDSSTQPLFPWDIRLSQMKSEIYDILYSASARLKMNVEILASILHLDTALEIRPTLCFYQDMPPKANVNTQEVILRLAYYHCIVLIHKASNKCKLTGADPGIGLEGISSSINLSLTASRSSLSLIQASLPMLKGECFWVVLFYALTAILTLFCNILKVPLQLDSLHDVNLLFNAPALIRRIPIRHLTPAKIIHLKFLDGFTTELTRLEMCAISKAQEKFNASNDMSILS